MWFLGPSGFKMLLPTRFVFISDSWPTERTPVGKKKTKKNLLPASTDLVILSVQDMVISCSPCRMPSHVCTGPRLRTGTVPSPDSILVRRWLRCFLIRCLLLCTANTIQAITAPSVHARSSPAARCNYAITKSGQHKAVADSASKRKLICSHQILFYPECTM